MKAIISGVDRLNQLVFITIASLFGVVAIITIYQVFARYVLNSPLTWSEELIRYSMVWIVLLGTAIALRKGLLISVEIILYIVPKIVKKGIETLIICLSIIFLSILVKYGLKILETTKGQTVGALDLPVAVTYWAIPVGGILALINSIIVLVELWFNKEEQKEEEQDGSTII